MRVLIINKQFDFFGGAEIMCYQLANVLEKNGHKTFFFATDKKPYYIENYEYSNYFPKYKVGLKNYFKDPLGYYYNIEAKNKLNSYLKEIKPDLIHIHSLGKLTYSILNCCKNIPTVMTIHSAYENICANGQLRKINGNCYEHNECQNGHFYNCIKNKCIKGKLEPSIRFALYAYIQYKNFKNIDYFISPSEALKKQYLKADKNLSEKNIYTINNFLEDKDINNTIPNYTNNGYFLYVGRIASEKGIHILLSAMKDLPKEIELHIVGTGPEEELLKQYALDNNLSNVKFLGFKHREELKEEYKNCISSIIPSNWFENFPTTNMESFINGKPVIGSNLGGVPEQIEHNKTGLLFEPANVKQLQECILTYWNNPDLVIEHGKNAYIKARTLYTEERYYNELIQVYEKAIKGSK